MAKPLIGIGADVFQGTRERAFAYVTYVEAVKRAGGVPVVIPPQPENVEDVVGGLDGVLLAGGEDCDPSVYGEEPHPNCKAMDARRQANDLALAKAARDLRVPALGICLGVQMMNVAAGGTLIQDIASQHDNAMEHASDPTDRRRHEVRVHEGTRLESIIGSGAMNVNSSHHQAVKRAGAGLRVTAQATDGIIEGLEDPDHPFYVGVQWHPEDMNGEGSASKLFQAFIEAARRRRADRESTE
ncbi:MAG TPA: gamma-glutamyl-gamma-aminobutyrate hydrolase family protein [Thermoanaerobaculia bacterium]